MPAIKVHHTATCDQPWDAGEMVKRLNADDDAEMRACFAWYDGSAPDPDGDGYPDRKSDWKFPHHMVNDDGHAGAANMRACSSAIGVLNGGRGGADIPGKDRQAVYDHLAAHMKDAGMDCPELEGLPAEGVERRAFNLSELRVDPGADGGMPTIRGHAAVFDQFSEDLGGFREKIKPGAFAKTIKEADVRALWNHNPDYVLGRTKSGTLSLSEDSQGLAIRCTPPDTQWARDLIVSMQRGDIDQMSFGFYTVRDEWDMNKDENGLVTRTLVEVRIFDVSPVTYPAYPQTSVSARELLHQHLSAAPPQAGHPAEGDEDPQAAHDILRRRLQLLE